MKNSSRAILIGVLLAGGITVAEYVSVVKNGYTIIENESESDMYNGTDNKETDFPIGHVMVGWVGSSYVQSNVNNITKLYLVTDKKEFPRYAADWYGPYNSGVYLEGDWQYRGHIASVGNVKTGLFVRVK